MISVSTAKANDIRAIFRREEMEPVLRQVIAAARPYLAQLDTLAVKETGAEQAAAFDLALPEFGMGAEEAVRYLGEYVRGAGVQVDGPRFFHLVAGGSTPAATGGDMLCTAFDQHAFAAMSSPAAVRLEQAMIDWLKDLFDLPASFGGTMVTGGTMANFVALACARQWALRRFGVDAAEEGAAGAPQVRILSGGYLHGSVKKAASMLGIGRRYVDTLSAGESGRVDLEALERSLAAGGPTIVVANAGEVNAGEFDPIEAIADLARAHDAWLHVDGTFGLFARVSPDLAHLAAGAERGDSVTADGHKWLNVPFDTGFCFLREPALLREVFALEGAYLNDDPDAEGMLGLRGPEMSRRARALPVFATLAAYGRVGYRALVEHGVALARELAGEVEAADDFELLVPPRLCITSFRYRPAGLSEEELDALNRALGEAILSDGRIYMGTTVSRGHVAFKPAFVNWRTSSADVQSIIEIVRELGERLRPGASATQVARS